MNENTVNYIEVLDGSRIHPETYEWARKMAVDALEYDEVRISVDTVMTLTGLQGRTDRDCHGLVSLILNLHLSFSRQQRTQTLQQRWRKF